MTDPKEPAPQGGQDLKRLERRVTILNVCNLILCLSIVILSVRYINLVHAVDLLAENIRLLSLRFDLLNQATDSARKIVGDVFEFSRVLTF